MPEASPHPTDHLDVKSPERGQRTRRRAVAGGLVVVTAAATAAAIILPSQSASADPALQRFDSCEAVDTWLKEAQKRQPIVAYDSSTIVTEDGKVVGTARGPANDSSTAVGSNEFGTNVQESDVDEPTRVKVVGDRVYAIAPDPTGSAADRLMISKVSDNTLEKPKLIDLPKDNHYTSMLVVEGKLVLFGTKTPAVPSEPQPVEPDQPTGPPEPGATTEPAKPDQPPEPGATTEPAKPDQPAEPGATTEPPEAEPEGVQQKGDSPSSTPPSKPQGSVGPMRYEPDSVATIVDISKAESPAVLSTATRPGTTISARMSNKVIRWVTSAPKRAEDQDCKNVFHPEGDPRGTELVNVTTINPAKANGKKPGVVNTTGVVGDGAQIYATSDDLYIADYTFPQNLFGDTPEKEKEKVNTALHSFDISQPGETRYQASATVEGKLLNQWSMSSRDGHLRVASTRHTGKSTDAAVTIFKQESTKLSQVGQVNGLGKTEEIKAVRWFDDRALVVTFKQTDPLYVVDLANPKAPQTLGELKVPGFSSYLHPIGDHKILGIGSSATDEGKVTGAQVSVFDVADAKNPKRVSVLTREDSDMAASTSSTGFSYLPKVRTAVTSAMEQGGQLIGFTVSDDGKLSVAGNVQVPEFNDDTIATVGDDKVVVMSSSYQDPEDSQERGQATLTLTLVDAKTMKSVSTVNG